jgi:RES domain-containing protein
LAINPETITDTPDDPRAFGDAALLEVPSAIVRESANILINPAHRDAKRIAIDSVRPFTFDERLWRPR